jgi:hypothetical protein
MKEMRRNVRERKERERKERKERESKTGRIGSIDQKMKEEVKRQREEEDCALMSLGNSKDV